MMMVLQRLFADHRLTYGELSFCGQVVVTLEHCYPWQHVKQGRIPPGTYVARLEGNDILIDDVPGHDDIRIRTGNYVKESNGSPLVGMQRGAKGTVVYSQDAHDIIREFIKMHESQENFLDVRDMP